MTKVTFTIPSTCIKVGRPQYRIRRPNGMKTNSYKFSSGNLAFVLVVLAAYASAATSLIYSGQAVPTLNVAAFIIAAVLYLSIGVVGFNRTRESGDQRSVVLYLSVQLVLAGALILIRGSSGELSLILLPLAGQAALLLSTRWLVPVCAFIYMVLVMPLIISSRWVDAIAIAVVYGTGIVFVVVFTRVAASEREARRDLDEANQLLRDGASKVEELAITKERNRLAREIHDSVGHYLTVVNVQIGAAEATLDSDLPRAKNHLSTARTLTKQGLAEVRHSVAALRAPSVHDRPLTEALSDLIRQWEGAHLVVRYSVDGAVRTLTSQTTLTLYRGAQEALTNVGKHAQASKVDIHLQYGSDTVRLTVQDNGIGSERLEDGFGLLGIRERVQLLRGTMQIRASPGQGFFLDLEVPE